MRLINISVLLTSLLFSLAMFLSSLATAEDTDIFFTTPSASAQINGPLIMILLDTGEHVSQFDLLEIADGLAIMLDEMEQYDAKVGVAISSHGGKIAIPVANLSDDASVVSPNPVDIFTQLSVTNLHPDTNEFETAYFHSSSVLQDPIESHPIHTLYAQHYNNATETSISIFSLDVDCPYYDAEGNRAFLLPYQDNSSTGVGYRLIGEVCHGNSIVGSAPEIYYRFTGLMLNRYADIGNETYLVLDLGCMGINIPNPDDATPTYVNRGRKADIEKLHVGATDYKYCEYLDEKTELPANKGTENPTGNDLLPITTRWPIINYAFDITAEYSGNSGEFATARPNIRTTFTLSEKQFCREGIGCTNEYVYDALEGTISFPVKDFIQNLADRQDWCGADDKGITFRVRPRVAPGGYDFNMYYHTTDNESGQTPVTNTNTVSFRRETSNNYNFYNSYINYTTRESGSSSQSKNIRFEHTYPGSATDESKRPIVFMRPMLTAKAALQVTVDELYPTGGLANDGCIERRVKVFSNGSNAWSFGQTNPNWVNRVSLPISKYLDEQYYENGQVSCEAQPAAGVGDVYDNHNRSYTADMYIGKRAAMVLNFNRIPLTKNDDIQRAFLTFNSPILSRQSNDTYTSQVQGGDPRIGGTPPYDYQYTDDRQYTSNLVSQLKIYTNGPRNRANKIDGSWQYPAGVSQSTSFNYPFNGDDSPAFLYKFPRAGGLIPSNQAIAEYCGTRHLTPGQTIGSVVNWNLGNWNYEYSKLPGSTPVETDPDRFNVLAETSYNRYKSPDLTSQINSMFNLTHTEGGVTNAWEAGNALSFVLQNGNNITNDNNYDRYKSSSSARIIGFGSGGDSSTFGTEPQPSLTIYHKCVLSATENCQSVKEYILNYVRGGIRPFGRWSMQAQLTELIRYLRGDNVVHGFRRGAKMQKSRESTNIGVKAAQVVLDEHYSLTRKRFGRNDIISNPSATTSTSMSGHSSCNSAEDWNLSSDDCAKTTNQFLHFSSLNTKYKSPFDQHTFTDCDKFFILLIGRGDNFPRITSPITYRARDNSASPSSQATSTMPYFTAHCDFYLAAGSGYFQRISSGEGRRRCEAGNAGCPRIWDHHITCLHHADREYRGSSTDSDYMVNYLQNTGVISSTSCENPVQVLSPIGYIETLFNLEANNKNIPLYSGKIPFTADLDENNSYENLRTQYRVTSSNKTLNFDTTTNEKIASSNARAYYHIAYCLYEMLTWLADSTKTTTTIGGEVIPGFQIHSYLYGGVPVNSDQQPTIWETGHNAHPSRPNFLKSEGAANAVLVGASRIGGGTASLSASSFKITTWLNNALLSVLTSQSSFVSPVVSLDQLQSGTASGFIYFSHYLPTTKHHWVGNLKKYRICLSADSDCTPGNILGSNYVNDGTGTGVYADDTGTREVAVASYWDTTLDSANVLLGGAGQKLYEQIDSASSGSYSYDISLDAKRVLYSSLFPGKDIHYPFSKSVSDYYPVSSGLVDFSDIFSDLNWKSSSSDTLGNRQYNIINSQTVASMLGYCPQASGTNNCPRKENDQSNYNGSYNCWYLRALVQYAEGTPPDCSLQDSNTLTFAPEYYKTDAVAQGIASALSWLYGYSDVSSVPFSAASPRWPFSAGVHVTPKLLYFNGESDNDVVKIIMGTNDGQIRLINDETGQEEWAYQLNDVFPKMYKLYNSLDPNSESYDYQTEYRAVGMDGEIATKRISCLVSGDPGSATNNCHQTDRIIHTDDSEAISTDGHNIYFGLRRGGVGIYSMNISLIKNDGWSSSCNQLLNQTEGSCTKNDDNVNHVIPSLNYRITGTNFEPPQTINGFSTICTSSHTSTGTDFSSCLPDVAAQDDLSDVWVEDTKIGQVWHEPLIVSVKDSSATASNSAYSDAAVKASYNIYNVPNGFRDVIITGGGFNDDYDVTDYSSSTPTPGANAGNAIYFINAYSKSQAEEFSNREGGSTTIYEASNPIALRISNDGATVPGSSTNYAVGDYADMIYPFVAAPVALRNTVNSDCDALATTCIERIYAVDIVGNIFRIDVLDLGSSSTRVIVKKVARLGWSGSSSRRLFFFNRPDVVQVRNFDFGSFKNSFDLIVVNSGNREKPLSSVYKQDGAFAVVEKYALNGMSTTSTDPDYHDNHPSEINFSNLKNLSSSTQTSDEIRAEIYDPSSTLGGWYVNFENSSFEHATNGGFIFNGLWIFPSFSRAGTNFVVEANQCTVNNGSGYLWVLDVLSAVPVEDVNNDGVVDLDDRRTYQGGSPPSVSLTSLGGETKLIVQAGGTIAGESSSLTDVIDQAEPTKLESIYWYEE